MSCATTKEEKRKEAFYIFFDSVMKPDPQLRVYAHEQECFHELMEWREEVLKYLTEVKEKEFG